MGRFHGEQSRFEFLRFNGSRVLVVGWGGTLRSEIFVCRINYSTVCSKVY